MLYDDDSLLQNKNLKYLNLKYMFKLKQLVINSSLNLY